MSFNTASEFGLLLSYTSGNPDYSKDISNMSVNFCIWNTFHCIYFMESTRLFITVIPMDNYSWLLPHLSLPGWAWISKSWKSWTFPYFPSRFSNPICTSHRVYLLSVFPGPVCVISSSLSKWNMNVVCITPTFCDCIKSCFVLHFLTPL